jgi:DHA1 family inner membrane transport protein
VTTVILLAICLLSAQAVPTVALIVLLGLFGLGANPVLISLAVRFAGSAPTLGSSLSVSAYNVGTAVGTWVAGVSLGSVLGTTGPAVVGTVIAALTLLPTVALARRSSAAPTVPTSTASTSPAPRPSDLTAISDFPFPALNPQQRKWENT